jgi:hypothetical protein
MSPSPAPTQVKSTASDTEAPLLDDSTVLRDPATVIWQPFDEINMMFPANNGSFNFTFQENQYNKDDLHSYSFDDTTVFKGAEEITEKLLEGGKNPGLGVRLLHEQGITGKGVNVAIIDQNLLGEHPEYAGRIAAYYDSGCDEPEDSGSYHGASVLSILAGETIGVAPEAKVYYAAAPSWYMDSTYFADCLYWIIEQNRMLPEDEKIRVVSVSSAPQDGWYTNAELWTEAVRVAEEEDILALDCRSSAGTGFVFSAYYDPSDPDNVAKCRPFYPEGAWDIMYDDIDLAFYTDNIFAPASFRTLAQELMKGVYCYRYEGVGGQSWAVPYVAGVLALGWQLRPDIPADRMRDILFASCHINDDGLQIIDPLAFIESIQNY